MAKQLTAIESAARALGFDAVGFVDAASVPSIAQPLQHWLSHNYHGSMSWMADKAHWRAQPQHLWPQVRTIISLGTNYAPNHNPLQSLAQHTQGNISVYARGRDYHDVIKGKLKQLAHTVLKQGAQAVKVFVDTAPVAERNIAQAAGLGTTGKHSNLIGRGHGSWLFLSHIFTDLVVDDIPPAQGKPPACGSCTRCLDICPTQAFVAPYVLNAQRCISYLTIEYDGVIDPQFYAAMGNRIYGCDDCLAVCPWNKFATPTPHTAFAALPSRTMPPLAQLLRLTDGDFRALFSQSPVKRIGWARFMRNVLIAAGNANDATLWPLIAQYQHSDVPLLRQTAALVLSTPINKK